MRFFAAVVCQSIHSNRTTNMKLTLAILIGVNATVTLLIIVLNHQLP